jgi:hypothetical protein
LAILYRHLAGQRVGHRSKFGNLTGCGDIREESRSFALWTLLLGGWKSILVRGTFVTLIALSESAEGEDDWRSLCQNLANPYMSVLY